MKDHPDRNNPEKITLVRAAAVADERGILARPGCVLLARRDSLADVVVLDVAERIDPPPGSSVLDRRDDILIPGLVNAHCHLDLTAVGPRPRPKEGGFTAWLAMLRDLRPQTTEAIADSVRRGIELSLAGGVVAVGDIAGSVRSGPTPVPWRVLRQSPLLGVSFLEFFSFGRNAKPGLDAIRRTLEQAGPDHAMLGLQPHAPYSVNRSGYEWAVGQADRLGLPVSTHLAESEEEVELIARGTGRQRVFLEQLGIWDDHELASIGRGLHPVKHLEGVLERRPWVLAHVNHCTDEAIAVLARTRASVVFCPRAWRYFGFDRRVGPHRYRAMMAQGVRVCLGTDSMVNLPPGSDSACGGRLSVLDEARALRRAGDDVDSGTLLQMMTTAGAAALGLDEASFRFSPGHPIAGVVAVRTGPDDPLEALFVGDAAPELLFAPSGRRAQVRSTSP
ncbi:MAG: amidohydrolase family protein [Phycisphaerales bacterium]